MLGSLSQAEDILQETLIAAWRGLDSFAERGSLRAWLYRIATNRCLNWRRDTKRRQPPEPVPPFEPPEPTRRGDVTWLQPYPDTLLQQVADHAPGPEARYQRREATEVAFIVGLQRLPLRQAATLLLRDVLGYTGAEVAALLDTSQTAIKGALQRARTALDRPVATAARDATPIPGSPQERELARRFADAFTADDMDAVIALLTDDAWLAMPPAPHEYQVQQRSRLSCGQARPGADHAGSSWCPPVPTPSRRSAASSPSPGTQSRTPAGCSFSHSAETGSAPSRASSTMTCHADSDCSNRRGSGDQAERISTAERDARRRSECVAARRGEASQEGPERRAGSGRLVRVPLLLDRPLKPRKGRGGQCGISWRAPALEACPLRVVPDEPLPAEGRPAPQQRRLCGSQIR